MRRCRTWGKSAGSQRPAGPDDAIGLQAPAVLEQRGGAVGSGAGAHELGAGGDRLRGEHARRLAGAQDPGLGLAEREAQVVGAQADGKSAAGVDALARDRLARAGALARRLPAVVASARATRRPRRPRARGRSSRHSVHARRALAVCQGSSPCAQRMSRDSSPEPARTCPGASGSTSVTSQSPSAQWRASDGAEDAGADDDDRAGHYGTRNARRRVGAERRSGAWPSKTARTRQRPPWFRVRRTPNGRCAVRKLRSATRHFPARAPLPLDAHLPVDRDAARSQDAPAHAARARAAERP